MQPSRAIDVDNPGTLVIQAMQGFLAASGWRRGMQAAAGLGRHGDDDRVEGSCSEGARALDFVNTSDCV